VEVLLTVYKGTDLLATISAINCNQVLTPAQGLEKACSFRVVRNDVLFFIAYVSIT